MKLGSVVGLSHPQENHHLSEIMKQAFLHSETSTNVISGLMATEISPIKPDIFTNYDFTTTYVTEMSRHKQKIYSEINNTLDRQYFPRLSKVDSCNGTDSPYNSHIFNMILSSVAPNLQCMEQVGSIWRLYARFLKPRHETNDVRQEGREEGRKF